MTDQDQIQETADPQPKETMLLNTGEAAKLWLLIKHWPQEEIDRLLDINSWVILPGDGEYIP